MSENTHFIFAASESSFADTMQIHHCDTINQHGLSGRIQSEFVINFTKLYGKRFTDEQRQKIQDSNPATLSILLNSLINFGSHEKLNDRIDELTKTTLSIFYLLMCDGDKTFSQNHLQGCSARALIVLAMHGDEGISESDFLEACQISMAQWAIIRPWVLQFCHGNISKLRLMQSGWCNDVKLNYGTSGIANIGYHMIEWWYKQQDRLKEMSSSIASIYLFIWHLPFEMGEDVSLMKQRVLSVLLSPETSKLLPSHYHTLLWSHFKDIPFSYSTQLLLGKPINDIPFESKEIYYYRLIRTAKSLNRTQDLAWCYRQLALIQKNKTQSSIMEANAFLAEGRASKAVNSITGILNRVTGSKEEILQKRFVRANAFIEEEKLEDALKETMIIFDLMEDFYDSDKYKNAFKTLYLSICHVLAFKTTGNGLVQAAHLLNLLIEQDTFATTSIADPLYYDFYMACAFLSFKSHDWERMLHQAEWAKITAWHSYGGSSFQYGRAHALHNYAYKKLFGKLYDSRTVRIGSYLNLPYARKIVETADNDVIKAIERENGIYKELVQEMGGTLHNFT